MHSNNMGWVEQLFHYSRIKQREQKQQQFHDLMASFLEAYVSLAILEARIENRFAPCEGILTVKEHK